VILNQEGVRTLSHSPVKLLY